ncbi:MAG TPA: HAMP domain-containing sensor histidine kinase [Acidimicrobiales bacterium]|nr:HAMP domain-containing sensor histidine kinase [Acidimicrobiales bacterium]
MRGRLLFGFVVVAVVAIVLLIVPVGFTLDARERGTTLTSLQRDSRAVSTVLSQELGDGNVARALRFAQSYARSTGRQILVTGPTGTLIATRPNQVRDPQIARVLRAFRGAPASGTLPQTVIEGAQYYVILALHHSDTQVRPLVGVDLVVTFPETLVRRAIRGDWERLVVFALLILLVAVALGYVLSTSLTRTVRRIGQAVEAIGQGKLDTTVPTDSGPPELRRLAEAINATAARLIRLLEVERTFVENASHQLRTPLAALRLHVENLQGGPEGPGAVTFEPVRHEIDRLARLVTSLLEMARIESAPSVVTTVDLARVASERTHYWQPLADELGIDLAYEGPESLLVRAVEGVCEQVVDNLLSNAFDASPSGGPVRVTVASDETRAHLHVIDAGVGLGEVERRAALGRFWRGTSVTEGTGLGLAIVDQLVRLSAGTVELLAADTGGVDASVTFLLPLRAPLSRPHR